MEKTQLRLKREDLIDWQNDNRYWFYTLTSESLEDNRENIDRVEQFHLQDIQWDGTPNFEEVKKRIFAGSQCHLWMFEDKCLGWHWTSDTVTLDWKTSIQTLKQNELYIGGAFLSRVFKPSARASLYFFRQGFEYSFKLHKADTMYLYTDSWNRASSLLCMKCGFTKYEFLVG